MVLIRNEMLPDGVHAGDERVGLQQQALLGGTVKS